MTQNVKFRLRRMILLTLWGVTYILLVLALFQALRGTGNLFEQFLLVSILLILSSFLAVDLQTIRKRWIFATGAVLMCITTFIALVIALRLGTSEDIGLLGIIAPAGVMILLHVGLLFLFSNKRHVLRNRRKVNGLSFLTPGVAVFAFSIAAMFALLTSAKMTVQKVNCDDFYKAVTDVVRFFGSPVLLGVDAKNTAQQWIEDARTSSLGELIGVDKLNINDFTSFPSTRENDDTPSLESIIDMMEQESNENEFSNEENGGLLQFLESYRKRFVTELIKDKDMINKGLCGLIIDEVEKKLEKPGFRFSVAILLFFIFSPIISFLFWVVIVVGFILFQILKFFGVRHTEKVLAEVEVIK